MADDSEHDLDQKATALLRDVFSRHGYGFHFAVTNALVRLHHKRRSSWMVETVEFPVEVHGTTLHIDIVLRNVDTNAIAVVECKRANPALATWCFGKSGYAASRRMTGGVALEGAMKPSDATTVYAFRPAEEHSDHQYNVAQE